MTIAGSDSGGGAGIQADLKTFQRLGVYGTTVVTAVTAQDTLAVHAWEAVSAGLVERQLDAVFADLPPAALKTGMLGSENVATTVAIFLERVRPANLVIDPVIASTSGTPLLQVPALQVLIDRLIPLSALVTPNLAEAEALTGIQIRNHDDMRAAGRALIEHGAGAALIKGGHLHGDALCDILVTHDGSARFDHPRQAGQFHGTGCVLSAAITATLAIGKPLEEAVAQGIEFVQRAMKDAPGLGRGNGPLGI